MTKYSFKVTGLERKQIATVIAETIGEQVKYAGAPSFNYNVGGWAIDKTISSQRRKLESKKST